MDLQIITGQLNIKEGQSRPSVPVPGLLAQTAPRKADKLRRQDALFVHLTLDPVSADVEDALLHDLVDALAAHYYQSGGSINTALRQSVRHINDLLLNWNINNGGMRREGAVTCGALKGEELFVVQAGTALALMGRNFGAERLPAHEPDVNTPLGTTANLDFRFGHYRLQPGDMFLLADPALIPYPNSVIQPALIDTEVEIGLEVLKDIVGSGSARLLLIEFTDDAPLEFPESDGFIEMLGNRQQSISLTRTAKPVAEGTQPRPSLSQIELAARRGVASAAIGVSKATDGIADVLEQVRPVEPEPETPTAPAEWGVPLAVAFLVPIIIGIILTSVFLQWDNTQRLGEITQQMETLVGLAADQEDETLRRNQYLEVLRLGAQASEIRPQDTQVLALQRVAMEGLDRLDDITRLSGRVVAAIEQDESLLTSVAISNEGLGEIYALDQGLNRVWRVEAGNGFIDTLSGPLPAEQILFGTEAVQTQVVGQLVDLLWRSAGVNVSQDGIAMLDSTGAIYTYYPAFGNKTARELPRSEGWRTPSQLETFSERVYVLDGQAGFVWRYLPEGDDLYIIADSLAIEFFETVPLSQAADIAINAADGTVVILYQSGGLIRYADGRSIWPEGTLANGGLTIPMSDPVAVKIIGRGSTASIYALDPGTGRLLRFSLSGQLLAQYRVNDENGQELLPRATDFDVAESPLRVFISADNQLYLATLE